MDVYKLLSFSAVNNVVYVSQRPVLNFDLAVRIGVPRGVKVRVLM